MFHSNSLHKEKPPALTVPIPEQRGPCPRCPALSLPGLSPLCVLGTDLAFPHFSPLWSWTGRWVEGAEEKNSGSLWLPGMVSTWSLPPWFIRVQRASRAPPSSLLASLSQVCLTITSGWSAMWMSHMQELTVRVLNISLKLTVKHSCVILPHSGLFQKVFSSLL